MSLLIPGTNSIKDTGYDVANSCRFNDGSSDTLSRTPSSGGNNKTWTYSAWVKRSNIGVWGGILDAGDGSSWTDIYFYSSDKLTVRHYTSGSTPLYLETTRIFRDPSAWVHIVVAVDTTQSTASNRAKIYVNGAQVTSFSSETYPSQNYDTYLNSTNEHRIGVSKATGGSLNYFDGYLAEVCLIDGTALDQTSFGEFDEDSPTIWKPKDVSGLTFGTNGFYLDFEDSSALGNDVSGNNNDYTANNLTSVDQSTDTCTNNFATLNPLYKQDHAFSEGNLGYTSSASDWDSAPTTIAASSGKYYCEMKVTAIAGGVTRSVLGICDERDGMLVAESEFGLTSSTAGDNVGYGPGAVHKNGSGAGGSFASYTTNDIIGMYADLDNGKVYFSKNGTMQNSGDPTSGSTGTGAISITTGATYLFGATAYGGGASQMNFGSPPYSISSGNADPNGYGNFEYGTQNYYALNSKNLAEFG